MLDYFIALLKNVAYEEENLELNIFGANFKYLCYETHFIRVI